MDELERTEIYRRRWKRARARLHMEDAECKEFGRGRLPAAAEEIRARLLILPADPERHCVNFDESFWAWWGTDSVDPHTNQSTRFGLENSSSSDAAYRYRGAAGQWERYLSMSHSGAFEMCLGWDAVFPVKTPQQADVDVFCIVTIVGRTAAGLAQYGAGIERFALEGPWEVTLGLRRTRGALLGFYGEGWTDVGSPRYLDRKNPDDNVLMHRELQEWPDADGVRQLAYELGDQIENSWGSSYQRYLARDGQYAGQFDVRKYISRE